MTVKSGIVEYGAAAAVFISGGLLIYHGVSNLARLESEKNKIEVQQQNVLGNEKPETYVEVNGVKYYSHIDGKEISDLVKE